MRIKIVMRFFFNLVIVTVDMIRCRLYPKGASL